MAAMAKTTCTWSLPVGIRDEIVAEARRRDVTPSKVVEAIFTRYLPTFVSESLTEKLAANGADDLRLERRQKVH